MDDATSKIMYEIRKTLGEIVETIDRMKKISPNLKQRIEKFRKAQAEKGLGSAQGDAGSAGTRRKTKSDGGAKPKKRVGKVKKDNEGGTK